MPRTRSLIPSYLHHRQSGQARVVVYDHHGRRSQILLPGPLNSKESLDEYQRICALVRTNNGRLPASNKRGADMTVAELILRYMEDHALSYYVAPITKQPTSEITCLRAAFRPLNRLFGDLPVPEFDSLKLETFQNAVATGSWLDAEERTALEKRSRPTDSARSTVNSHVERIKRLFRWGCAKKLVAAEQLTNLLAVAGLKKGRTVARETEPVLPVDPDIVEKTLPHMPPVPADMVRILLLTGARVGELCKLRVNDLDRRGPIWLFTVKQHKTAHHGHVRTIPFGPKAQLILRKYLKADPDAVLFSPPDQDRFIRETKRETRKTPVQPSQRDRSSKKPLRKPGKMYSPPAINHAVRRACIKAGIAIWHTHQLRHAASLAVMHEFGVEAARSVLGHKTLNMTLHYAGVDLARAQEVAAKIG